MLSSSSQAEIETLWRMLRDCNSGVRNDSRSMGDIDLEQSNDLPIRQEVSSDRDQLRSSYSIVTDPACISGFVLAPASDRGSPTEAAARSQCPCERV